jgi:hypothetical protein
VADVGVGTNHPPAVCERPESDERVHPGAEVGLHVTATGLTIDSSSLYYLASLPDQTRSRSRAWTRSRTGTRPSSRSAAALSPCSSRPGPTTTGATTCWSGRSRAASRLRELRWMAVYRLTCRPCRSSGSPQPSTVVANCSCRAIPVVRHSCARSPCSGGVRDRRESSAKRLTSGIDAVFVYSNISVLGEPIREPSAADARRRSAIRPDDSSS